MPYAEHAPDQPQPGSEEHHRLRRQLLQLADRLTGVGHDLDPQNQNHMSPDHALGRMTEVVNLINNTAQQIAGTALSQTVELPHLIDRDVEPSS
jgi:hypothetical protein